MATHDYNLANASGASFRADLNNALQAILTNNSSASAPSTTAAYMFWADTNTGILKIRNSANDAWIELLQLDGTLTLEDGSASAVALGFRDELNTGIFSSGSNNFDISINGTTRLNISASGISVTGSVTASADSTINTLTVGEGANSVAGNTVLGYQALDAAVTGANNTAIGYQSLTENTSGADNVSVGKSSLDANTSGANNVAIGTSALGANTTANDNVAVGVNSLINNTT